MLYPDTAVQWHRHHFQVIHTARPYRFECSENTLKMRCNWVLCSIQVDVFRSTWGKFLALIPFKWIYVTAPGFVKSSRDIGSLERSPNDPMIRKMLEFSEERWFQAWHLDSKEQRRNRRRNDSGPVLTKPARSDGEHTPLLGWFTLFLPTINIREHLSQLFCS